MYTSYSLLQNKTDVDMWYSTSTLFNTLINLIMNRQCDVSDAIIYPKYEKKASNDFRSRTLQILDEQSYETFTPYME